MHSHEHHDHHNGVCMKHVIKRRGGEEHYDIRKVYGSVFAASLASGGVADRHSAEKLAEQVSDDIDKWINGKMEISSTDIFEKTVDSIKERNEKIGFFYESHRDLS